MNFKLPVRQATRYSILIGDGILKQIKTWLTSSSHRLIIITDNTVKKIYANKLMKDMQSEGLKPLLLSFPAGEKHKTAKTKQLLENAMLNHECGRDSLILALGGGVVGDVAGFVAATYMRGIPYIQLPTSLLAMVDSSIGGKTGINVPQGKNLVGAFWQPSAVVIDTECLATLPKKHIINGMLEALKVFLVSDHNAFKLAIKNSHAIINQDKLKLTNFIYRAIKAKKNIVQEDERESGRRMILNFGHTMGHALEKESDFSMLHGVAVGYGMLIEAAISVFMGILTQSDYEIIRTALMAFNIKPAVLKKFSIDRLIMHTNIDKKAKKGRACYVLLSGIGSVYHKNGLVAHAVSDRVIKNAFAAAIG